MMLTPEIIVLLIIESLVLLFSTIAAFFASRLAIQFAPQEPSAHQYKLLSQTYLTSSIIQVILFAKLASFPLFIFAADGLSAFIPGAMCAVGVINASSHGPLLLLLKLFMLYFIGSWIVINKVDGTTIDYRYTIRKYKLYLIIYVGLISEVVFTGLYLFDLDLNAIVSCCGTVFNPLSSTLGGRLLHIPNTVLLPSFYLTFLIGLYSAFRKEPIVSGIAHSLLLVLGLLTIISFFSTYVYQLPSHQCPFCLLQKEYLYMGYLLYPALIAGTFFGMIPLILKLLINHTTDSYRLAIIFNSLFVLIASAYPLFYFLRNGVWL